MEYDGNVLYPFPLNCACGAGGGREARIAF